MPVISEVNNTLQAMGLVQYLLVLLFLISYPLALTEFAGPRGRLYAAVAALAAAVAFVAFTNPWEHGVLLVAVAVLSVGFYAAAVWLLHAVLARLEMPAWHATMLQDTTTPAAQVPLVTALQEPQTAMQAAMAGGQHKNAGPGVLPIA